MNNTVDMVNNPPHYASGEFECIEVMEDALGKEAVVNFCICNAFKYIFRHKKKNGIEDIQKAKWYLNKYIELEENTTSEEKLENLVNQIIEEVDKQ